MKLKGPYNIWKYLFNLKVKFKEIKCMEIKPIPLTPDILKKNGWEFRRGFCFPPNEEGILICLIGQGGGVWDAYTGGKPLHSGINSVSDLQHLLFGLGINHEMEV